jgi:hypothetical protein
MTTPSRAEAILDAIREHRSAAPPVQMEAVAGDWIIKRPLRYEPEGHVGGPAIKDANGQLVAALYWPGHAPADTDRAEGELHLLASSFVDAGNGTDTDNADVYEIGKRDGFEDAVRTIDMRTGGDGEFYGSTIPGRGQDVPSMLEGIVDRFNAASPVPSSERDEYMSALRLVVEAVLEDSGAIHDHDGIADALEQAGLIEWRKYQGDEDLPRFEGAEDLEPGDSYWTTTPKWAAIRSLKSQPAQESGEPQT